MEVNPPGLSPSMVKPAVDKFGRVWCAAGGNWVFYFDTLTNKWSEPESVPINKNAFLIGSTRDGRIWIVAGIRGESNILFYDYTKWSMSPPVKGGLPVSAVSDSANRLWISWESAWDGFVNYYDGKEWSDLYAFTEPIGEGALNPPWEMTVDRYGRVWVSWISALSGTTKFFTRYFENGEWSDPLFVKEGVRFWGQLTSDTLGGVWAALRCSAYVFACYYNRAEWTTVDSFFGGKWGDSDICPDRLGRIWMVWIAPVPDTLGDLWFSYYNGERWSEPAPIHPCPGYDYGPSLVVDGKNRVWVFWIRKGKAYACHTEGEGIEEKNHREQDVKLFQSYPNPFSFRTTIRYSVAKLSYVSLRVYNTSGQLVKTLIEDDKKPGYYTAFWNGENDAGKKLSAGVYFYRMETEDFTKTHKALLLR